MAPPMEVRVLRAPEGLAAFSIEAVEDALDHEVVVLSLSAANAQVIEGGCDDVVHGECSVLKDDIADLTIVVFDHDQRSPSVCFDSHEELVQHGTEGGNGAIMLGVQGIGCSVVELCILGFSVIVEISEGLSWSEGKDDRSCGCRCGCSWNDSKSRWRRSRISLNGFRDATSSGGGAEGTSWISDGGHLVVLEEAVV